jgi:hypothetical protein
MENLQWVVLTGTLVIFGLIIYSMVRSGHRSRERKQLFSQTLGFMPGELAPVMVEKLQRLYQSVRFEKDRRVGDQYLLENVSTKRFPDGEMILFDLIDPTGEDNSYIENQAVAVHSPELDLPPFLIFPKTDQEGVLANAANTMLEWLIAQVGNPVDFSEHPAFDRRYLVSSPDPEVVRQFLDETKIRRLLGTSLLTIHAEGDLFTLSRIEMGGNPITQEVLTDRVNQALNMYSAFLN